MTSEPRNSRAPEDDRDVGGRAVAYGGIDDELIGGRRLHGVLVREFGPDVADVFSRLRQTQDAWHARTLPQEGLRERKKRVTRQRISDVATTLFVAQGFENVTVAEVADVVGVSEKTVYNYFPTKESLVFDDADAGIEALAKELRESAPDEPATKVMLRAVMADLDRFAVFPDEAAIFLPMFADMVATTPSLRAAWLDLYGRLIEVATRELAARAEVDPEEPEVIIAARAVVGLQEVSYSSLVRHARAGVRGVALRDAALADVERAARLLDTGLWSLSLLAQGDRNKQQLTGAARAAEEARRQVLGALRQARSTWADLRRQVAEQKFAGPNEGGQSGRERQAERRARHAVDHAAGRADRDWAPGQGRGRPPGPGRGRPPESETGLDQPARISGMAQEDDNLFGQAHVEAYQASGGERGYEWRGTHILLLTTTGRKSGEPRTTPLIHVTDGDGRWVVIASKGGAPEHPGWFENLEADARATIQVKADVIPVEMSVVEGPERDRLWGMMTDAWPAYDDYAAKTERHIPVVVFEPR